jgi:hypothetical protein
MHTTVKHRAAGIVKCTLPYKDFCIFFINWGMATDIKLKNYILYKYKEIIKEKRTIHKPALIIIVIWLHRKLAQVMEL